MQCCNSEHLSWPPVIEEANWLTLDRDVLSGDGFDAVICLGNSFAHLPDCKGKLAAVARDLSSPASVDGWLASLMGQTCLLPVFFSACIWEGDGRESTGGPSRWCLWPCPARR